MRVSVFQAAGEHGLGGCIALVTLLTMLLGFVAGAADLRRYLQMRRL